MLRRDFLKRTGSVAAGALLFTFSPLRHALAAFTAKITKTDAEWKQMLTPEQFDVLRQEGTERPFSSSLLDEHRKGLFTCVACGLDLFSSDKKFDSGTGWPSFFDAIPEHIETKTDHKLFMERTEYHCARCGGHQGHVFTDGPKPTGLRYCNNGIALKFLPQEG
jgi:peptide-methionine (R)-S-oxide reductase